MIGAREHLFKKVVAGQLGAGVQRGVGVASGRTAVASRFEIDEHVSGLRDFADLFAGKGAADVKAGAQDKPRDAFALARQGKAAQSRRGRVVQDEKTVILSPAESPEAGEESGAHRPTGGAAYPDLLAKGYDAPVQIRQDLRGIGVAQGDAPGPAEKGQQKRGRLLKKRLPADLPAAARHRHGGPPLYARPAVLKFHQCAAQVRAARVQNQDGFSAGEASVQAEPGGEHGKPVRFAPQPGVHLRAEVCRRALDIRMVRMHADLPQKIVRSLGDASHNLTSNHENLTKYYNICKINVAKPRLL